LVCHQVWTYSLVSKEVNPNALWNEISRDYWYDTSNTKGTIIQNPYI